MATFKSKSNTSSRRKREKSVSESSENSDGGVQVANLRTEKRFGNPMVQGTRKLGKSERKARRTASSDSSDEDKQDLHAVSVSYKSNRSAESSRPQDMGATAAFELDTAADRDNQALVKKSHEINKELKGKALGEDKIYRGEKNRRKFIEHKDSIFGNVGSGHNHMGPMRAPTNIRVSVRWDYAPDVCKDWKETGVCNYGDSCKFLHDRTDYKHGWQIERDLESESGYVDEDMKKYEVDSDEDDDLPFRCFICRDSFKTPIVTKCQHYFCEKCALERYQKKSKRCFVCGTQTMGVFNPAKELTKKLQRQKTKMEEKAGHTAASDASDDEPEIIE